MYWQQTPHTIFLIATAIISATSALYMWLRNRVPGSKTALLVALANVLWMVGYALESGSVDAWDKIFWNKMQYVGIVTMPTAWLVFTLQYTGREKWLTRCNLALLCIEPVATLVLVFTNETHSLIWGPVALDTSGSLQPLIRPHGVGYWTHAAYTYMLILVIAILLAQMLIRSRQLYRRQASLLLFGALLPALGSAIMLAGLNPFPQLDLTPLAATASSLILTWSLFRTRVGDIVPVARGVVVESMRDGVIVLDEQNRIVDLNASAQRMVDHTPSAAIGQPLERVRPDWSDLIKDPDDNGETSKEVVLSIDGMQRTFDVRISPTVDWRGRTTSRVVVLRDSTDRKRAETALRELNATLEAQVAARTAELTQAVDRLKHVHAIGQTVARAPGLTGCMQAVAQGTVERLGFDVAAFSLYDRENQTFIQLGAYPMDDRLQSALGMLGIDLSAMHWPYRCGINPTMDRIMDGQIHVCQSLADLMSPPLPRPAAEAVQRLFGLRAFLSIPLLIEGEEAVGTLVAATRRPEISTEEQRAAELVAREAAGAIKSARYLERLQGRTAELEAILHSTSEGIVVTDVQGDILLANPVAQSWLSQTLSPEDAARLQTAVQELGLRAGAAATSGEQPEMMLELTGLDLELKAAPIAEWATERPSLAQGEPATVVAIHDVSHFKALNRMTTRFVTNMSHELRTPVTTIKLYAHLMQRQPEKWEQYLPILAQEADLQARLIEDILQISRIDAGRLEMTPRPSSLNELTKTAVSDHQTLAQAHGLELKHRPAVPGPVALVDADRMIQVLNNLIENAIYYTPAGGQVVISTGKERAEGRTWATATVADTGMGIPAEELPHVFDRFFRGAEPRSMQVSGTGLGLAIVQEIVALHGGRVTVESQKGMGTTFTVWLPAVG